MIWPDQRGETKGFDYAYSTELKLKSWQRKQVPFLKPGENNAHLSKELLYPL